MRSIYLRGVKPLHPSKHRTWQPRFRTPNIRFHRSFMTQVPALLLPPVVFTGLFVSLWTWKCLMMVIFQNKIIYMPGLPPNARRERIADYASQCRGVVWREERTRSADGKEIALCCANAATVGVEGSVKPRHAYILYFQGNASSLPPRLPFLSPVLGALGQFRSSPAVMYTFVAVSYRGYWTSKGRPSERGILEDAAAGLGWIASDYANYRHASHDKATIILWGQSIGAGVATSLAARQDLFNNGLYLSSVILETPFTSIRDMLVTIYPQKWLPYRHLWPFLRNHLNSIEALEKLGSQCHEQPPSVIILEAGKDELVPKVHGDALEIKSKTVGIPFERHVINGAYHTEVMTRPRGRQAAVQAIQDAVDRAQVS